MPEPIRFGRLVRRAVAMKTTIARVPLERLAAPAEIERIIKGSDTPRRSEQRSMALGQHQHGAAHRE